MTKESAASLASPTNQLPHVTSAEHRASGLLVASENSLRGFGGGVQRCNLEYTTALESAGVRIVPVAYNYDRQLVQRFKRRFDASVSQRQPPTGLYERVEREVIASKPDYILYSLSMFSELSRKIKQRFPGLPQVFLSHGVEGIDFCIEQHLRRVTQSENRSRLFAERALGRELLDAMEQRRWIDGVIAMSPLEVEVEKWLGAPQVMCALRTVLEPPLDHRPIDGWVGCVSTLNHPPNLDGLVKVLNRLKGRVAHNFRFRLIGGPANLGVDLANRFPFVDYLGALSDLEVREEAASWCCFVHPMFVYAKGASMKLASALGWGLPIASTIYGTRGYAWDEQRLPLANSVDGLAQLVLNRCSLVEFPTFAAETRDVARCAPIPAALGREMTTFLSELRPLSR